MVHTARLLWLLPVLAHLAATSLAAEDAFEVYCQNSRSRIVSTGVFTTKDGKTGLRVCCGTKKADRKTAWYDDIVLDRMGATTPRQCDPAQRNSDSCCFDITPSGVDALPYPLSGLVAEDELPPQPAYVKDEGSQGSWLFWSAESMPYALRIWSENMQACHEGGGLLLDLPMLAAGYDMVPGVDSSTWSAGTTTVTQLLNALPTYVDEQTPLHAALRTGFPSDTCDQIDITDVIRDHYNLALPSTYPKFPNQRPYWEGSAIYADSGSGPGSDPSACQGAAGDGCCLVFYIDAAGQLQSTYQSCGGTNQRPSVCFKQRGFGRVSLDPKFVASYDSWQGMNSTCAAFQAPSSRLLVADTFYKRQYGFSALLWNDPQLLDSPLQQLPPVIVQAQGAIGLTQALGQAKTNEGWSWSDGQALPADSPDWYINANYFSEPNDYRASRLNADNTALGVTDKVEDGAENYGVLGVAGGSVRAFDVCPKKPDMSGIVAGFPADTYLTSGDAVAAMFKALTHVEHGSLLDVDLTSGGRKGLCEIQAAGSEFDRFEMANCVAYQDSAISGVAFNPGNGVPVFEARCSVTSGETDKLNSWRDSILSRASITSDQVGACPGGILKYAVTMDSDVGLKSIQPLCPSSNGINAGTATPVSPPKDASNSALIAAAVAVPLVAVCCSILAAALFCFRRRRKQKLAEAGKGSGNVEDGVPAYEPKTLARPPVRASSLTMSTAGIYGARTEPLVNEMGSLNATSQEANSVPQKVVYIPCSQEAPHDTLSDLTYTAQDATLGTNDTVSKFNSVHEVNTIREGLDFITYQISLLLQTSQGVIFDRYRLHPVNEIRYGGQGLVHFASSRFTPKQYAIKFFVVRAAFQAEMDLYQTPGLHSVLPPLDDMSDNSDRKWTDPMGRPLPPYLIMERGEALNEWVQRAAPDSLSTLAMIGHLMDAVAKVHNTGLAHRDLKPANCIFLSSTNCWTLIDFGSAAPIGREAGMSISAHYAAPEVATAYEAGQNSILVTAAVDVWALGLMAFELFTKTKAFPPGSTREQVFDALTGRAKLPWEKEDDPMFQTYMKQLGRMRSGVLSMLHRDPTQRAKLNDVRANWHSVFDCTTHSSVHAAMPERS